MNEIQEHVSLKSFNTLRINANARYFCTVTDLSTLTKILDFVHRLRIPHVVLGAGSNVVFTQDFPGLVLHMAIKGTEFIEQSDGSVLVKAYAGEQWDDLVKETLRRNLYGLENLSMIPGTVGAAPIQNIGAFGVELKDVFVSLEAVDQQTSKTKKFDSRLCRFSYRNSIFKQEYKDRYVITSVTLKLEKKSSINIDYSSLKEELKKSSIDSRYITGHTISRAVCSIRKRRLPDPRMVYNVGSFFKNPIISLSQFNNLKKQYPNISHNIDERGRVKLHAAYLIEQCGWKGVKMGNISVYDKHALVLINNGLGTGKDIKSFAQRIQDSVLASFGVKLEIEPSLY